MANDVDIRKYGEEALKGLKGANWVVRVLLGLVVGALLYLGLPYVLSIVTDLTQVVIEVSKATLIGITMFGVLSFLWANKVLFRKIRESLARKMWKAWIYNDPLDFIEGVIDSFVVARKKISAALTRLRAVLNKLHMKANELIDKYKKGMSEAEVWEEQGNEAEADIQAYFAVSSKNSADSIAQSYLEVEESVSVFEEIDQMMDGQIRVMKHDLEMMQTNLEIAEIQAEAADVAQDAMEGNVTEMAMREFAKHAYKDKVAAGKAKLDQFMARARPILESNRIEKAINTKEGRKAIIASRNNKDALGLKGFREELERLKQQNPDLYGRKGVDLDRFKRRNPEPLRRSTGNATFGAFSDLQ